MADLKGEIPLFSNAIHIWKDEILGWAAREHQFLEEQSKLWDSHTHFFFLQSCPSDPFINMT